ncbi:MAG: CRISPR-associated endonuclease Cas2 [Patescibacteria group bacterium]
MFIISYDFENNKRRSQFSKFLKKYGHRIQYSVFEIKNSKRALENIQKEIEMNCAPKFTKADSILVFNVCETCKGKVKRYGYAKNEEGEVVFF